MNRSACVVVLIAVLAGALTGCGGAMSRGIKDFHKGRYPEAVVELMAVEPAQADRSAESKARYALYRGLTHLALGDTESAQRWVAEAKALWDGDHGLLDRKEQGRLLSGWESLGHEPGEWGNEELARRGLGPRR
ncbi:MAG TPA: hypothetical protein PLI95_21645 [Polyangiaceae bacterium]|nr:hypothetical protein [Polyangiaceae bacterium]